MACANRSAYSRSASFVAGGDGLEFKLVGVSFVGCVVALVARGERVVESEQFWVLFGALDQFGDIERHDDRFSAEPQPLVRVGHSSVDQRAHEVGFP